MSPCVCRSNVGGSHSFGLDDHGPSGEEAEEDAALNDVGERENRDCVMGR